MIRGIGIDIVEIARIKILIKRNPRFIEKVLSVKEQEKYWTLTSDNRRAEFVAGRFAAKEALGKALGTGLGKLSFSDISILNDALGKPALHFIGDDLYKVHVSISHSHTSAVANVVLES
ncbi:holo-[acyl-carrier-protein] synthase [Halolactibacillus miurensis]|uniref:Holo-[acyl-carrier-protein] synthase n=1 Tax=Halolactibacillus miurensis TaxID=306541 RepID=A0A1I6SKQ8_9BACI|nr:MULTISPECIES: holo-ACP synthase [Halolactibacillus]GEM04028.1 holo-[acyl-carrier-protein] synthase [Halolactibacillus miurensis]SFS77536.1 holo-[acyl-carrier protein] synthase [Halolactibacillus miurensis]